MSSPGFRLGRAVGHADKLNGLRRWLTDDYCARCDSFGHTIERDGMRWCCVCWKEAKPLPSSLRQFIATL